MLGFCAELLEVLKDKEMTANDLRIAINKNRSSEMRYQAPAFNQLMSEIVLDGLLTFRDGLIPNTDIATKFYSKSKEAKIPCLWKVVHKALNTDDIIFVSDLVLASSKEEALKKYNALARERKEHPYMWNEVELGAVLPTEVII